MSADASQRQRKVLVVDDDPEASALASQALAELGFVSEEAAGGYEALGRIEAVAPDLVILGLEIRGLSGFEVCAAIRASREIPVMVATRITDSDTIDRAYQAGATAFLKKPLDPSILRHHVRFVMRAHDAFVDLKRTLSKLEASDRRLESAQRLARLGHWEWTVDGGHMLWSAETFRILGFEPHSEPPTLETFLRTIHSEDRARVEKLMRRASLEHEPFCVDHRVLTPKREARVVQQNATVTADATGLRVSGTIQDITERQHADDPIDHLAHFDSLTALPNRRLLCEQLDKLLARARLSHETVGVIRLDLDRFKRVNDTLGHEVGDELLLAVAKHLQSCVRATDLVAQAEIDAASVSSLGGDEFSLILRHVRSAESLSFVARRILASFRLPFEAQGNPIEMSASLGVATFPGDGEDAEMLLRSAGTAMNHAKQQGGAAFYFFDPSMNELASRRMQIEMALQFAVERGQLRLVYQPQWDAKTRRVTGMEALLRWESEDLGTVSPAEFIPIAENANLVQRLGEWVFDEVCRQLRAWRHQGLRLVPVSVNFSSRQLRTTTIAKRVGDVMRSFEVDPSLIEIEMTESAFVGDVEEVLGVLSSLKATGVRIALDDFGTGYSSISHLARFPIDVLKIDQSFIAKIGEDEQSSTLVSALIGLAERLSLIVVAEGVETEEQASFLRHEGCQILQGYGLARPMEVAAATELLSSQAESDAPGP